MIKYILYISSIAIVVLVLLQQRGSGLGSTFGQEGGAYSTRRGAQKTILWATVVAGIVFIASAIISLL
jgi:protein translocase SecG subunit